MGRIKQQEDTIRDGQKDPLKRTTFLIPSTVLKEFKRISLEEERSMSNIVVELIKLYNERSKHRK